MVLPPTLRPRLLGATPVNVSLAVGVAVTGAAVYAYSTRRTIKMDTKPSYAGATPARPVFGGFGFKTLKLQSSELISPDTKRLRFEFPDANQPGGLSLTTAVLTFSFPGGGWIPCLRPYTPVNDLTQPGYLELMVKLYPNGKQSGHLHSLKPGDKLSMTPLKGFSWTPNKHPHVALIAGGAGITPMYQLAQGILNNPEDKTAVTLVWGVNKDADIFLKDEFAALEQKFPGRFRTQYVVSHPVAGSPHQQGYVTKQLLEGAGLNPSEAKNKDIKVFVCGPPAMEKALTGTKGWTGGKPGVLAELGYKPAQVHKF